jgi:hypothetical protein
MKGVRDRMQVLDLHGVKHHQVNDIVEDFILMTSDPIVKIITGNSNRMLELVKEVLGKYSLKYDYETWSNLGAIVAYEGI